MNHYVENFPHIIEDGKNCQLLILDENWIWNNFLFYFSSLWFPSQKPNNSVNQLDTIATVK